MDQDAAQQNQEKSAPGGGVASRPHPGASAEPESSNQKKQARSFRDSIEQSKLYIELMVAACAIAGILAVYWQLGEMKETNRLTRESLRLTRESNESSDRDTKRTQQLMAESNRLTLEALEASARQSEASRKQGAADAEASRVQSAKDTASSLNMVKSSLEVSERARLGIEGVTAYAWVPDTKASVTVMIRNSGHSPASNVIAVIQAQARPSSLPPLEPLGDPKGRKSRSVIPPGSTQSVTLVMPTLTAVQIAALRKGELILYVVGKVLYEDDFGHHHAVRFCSFHEAESDEWGLCFTGNEAS
jgi:hypothetical protein